jgi:hypothetical protein
LFLALHLLPQIFVLPLFFVNTRVSHSSAWIDSFFNWSLIHVITTALVVVDSTAVATSVFDSRCRHRSGCYGFDHRRCSGLSITASFLDWIGLRRLLRREDSKLP